MTVQIYAIKYTFYLFNFRLIYDIVLKIVQNNQLFFGKHLYMNLNIDYGLASLFVLGVLLVYNLLRKELPLRKNLILNILLIAIAAADILDIFSTHAEKHAGMYPPAFVYGVVLLFHAIVILIPVIICNLVITLSGRLIKTTKNSKTASFLFLTFVELVILSTPFTDLVFIYSVDGRYKPGPAFFPVFFVGAGILIYSCYIIAKYNETTRPLQRISIYLFAVITLFTCFVQSVLFPGLPIMCFGFTISVLIIYIAAQNTDALNDQRTGLFSREGLNALQTELYFEKRKSSLLCFTFANYNVIKTTYGDEIMLPCLRAIAAYIKNEISSGDILPFYIHNGRFLLLKTGYYDFSDEIKLLNERFKKPWPVQDINFQFSPVYSYISSALKISRMQEVHFLIDRALSDAVSNGAFSLVSIDEKLLHEVRHSIKIRKALDKALEADDLEVWFQPIWSPSLNRMVSAEALVRVKDDELGIIYPDEFIKNAESSGSIMKLGSQVYRRVCEFISRHDLKKYGIDYVELNLSPIQCLNEHLAEELIAIRKSYGISSKLINLEITETAASDSPIMMENMLRLSRDGFTFSLDDYGTGYSNLVNMLSLPLSIIKIDKSIVWSYFDQSFALAAGGENIVPANSNGHRDNNILEDLIPMFQSRGLKVVCEGVETSEMVRVLEELGCDYMQGYYFSKPVPEDELISFLKSKNRFI